MTVERSTPLACGMASSERTRVRFGLAIHFHVLTVAAIALASCSSCTANNGNLDASDARIDVAADHPRDVAPDESGADPGCALPAPPSGWSRLPLPCNCDFVIADDPATAAAPLEWLPCRDGTPGCREVGGVASPLRMGGASTVGGVVLFATLGPLAAGRYRMAFAQLDQPAFLLIDFAYSPQCFIVTPGCGTSEAVLEVDRGIGTTQLEEFFFRGELRNDPAWRDVAAHLGPIAFMTSPPIPTAAGIVLGADGLILRSDPATGLFATIVRSADVGATICCTQTLGNAILFSADTSQLPTWILRDGSPPRLLYRPTAPDQANIFQVADGTAYWFQGASRDAAGMYGSVSLWTSPISETSTSVTPRRVGGTTMHFFPSQLAGGGHMAFDTNGLDVIYVAMNGTDGSYWQIQNPTGMRPMGMVFLTDTEFAFALAPAGTTTPTTVRRQRLDALGPPLPALP